MTRLQVVICRILLRVETACFVASILLTACPGMGYATPQVSMHWIGGNGSDGCMFYGDGLTLTITDDGRRVLEKHYCSAYGKGEAHMVTDASGHHYVFLKYSEGHGSGATTDYLTIYRFTDRLIEKANLILSAVDGVGSLWTYDYRIHTPPEGGLKILFTLKLDGKPDVDMPLPPTTKIMVIDPAK